MARYTSNRFKDIVIGLPNYSEEKTALEVVGKVGIGTNDAKTPLWIEGNTNISGIITATTFKKEGGTNSQFLMADGSTNNLTYLTTETSTLDEILGRGNSTTKSLKVGISTFSGEINVGSGNSVSIGHSSPKALVDIRFNKLTDEGDAFNDSGNENFGGWRDAGLDIVRLENTGLDLGSGSLAVPEGKDVHTLVHFVSHWTDWWVGSKNVDSSNKGTFAIYYDGPGGAGLTDDGKPREVFIIDENQNVGIGTIDPSTAAHSGNDKVLNVGIVTANYLYGSLTGNSTGLSGSPNINVGILNASSGTVNGNFEVTGELTYADVTDVDSIGLVTARSGIHVGPSSAGVATITSSGNASFIGNITAASFSGSGASLNTLNASELDSGTVPDARFPATLPAISGANLTNVITTDSSGETENLIVAGISSLGIGTDLDPVPGRTDLYYQGDLKLKTTNAGVQVLGIMSATALDFTGASGAFANDVIFQGSSYNLLWDKSASILKFNDGAKAVFGTGGDGTSDLKIFHSGSNSYINEDGTGDLLITTGIGTTAAKVSDGSITLYHQGTERLKTTSSGVTITGDISGTISGTINGNASTATDLSINATQQLVLQTGNDATDVLTPGTPGYVLQSNGSGNVPTWEATAPANAITGLTVRKDDTLVGSANSVSTLNFVGAGVTFTSTAGIATITVEAAGGSSVMMSMIFG